MRILIIGYDWHVLFQRFQQIACELARTNELVYWHNEGFWGKREQRLRRADRESTASPRLRVSVSPRLPGPRVVEVPQMLPYRMRKLWPGVNAALVLHHARGKVPLTGLDAVILTTYETIDAELWKQIPARVHVYDCADDSVHFFAPGSANAQRVIRTEAEILRRADLVFASAPRLQQRLSAIHRQVVLVPNGADVEHFRPDPTLPVASELRDIREPVLGYVGAIEPWIDIDLIAKVADLLPDFRLVLVGPIGCDVSILKEKSNVLLVGRKPYADLPGFVRRFNVAMIPFVENDLTRSVDPIKFYEYCAAGIPTVATPMPTMLARSDIAHIAATPEEFARQVRQALTENDSARRESRIALARENSWSARAEAIVRAIRETAAGPRSPTPDP
jgi:glycosyltransferase involved in cell wall biosynthesis